MRISDFIAQSSQVDSPEAILALMERAAGDLGFDRYAYCALTRHDWYDARGNPAPAVAHNFPSDWIDYYFEHDYQSKDPVLQHAPEFGKPFLWDWLSTAFELKPAQQTLMQQAGDAGLRDGVAIPLHGPRGSVCLMTFAAGDGHAGPAAELSKLFLLAVQFHVIYNKVGRPDNFCHAVEVLSARERECLQWTASGKTSWATGRILKISENTVNFHIKNTFRKLNVNNRNMAVAKAIGYGLISP